MHDEIKGTAYIAVSLSLLAGLLVFISFALMERSNIANIRNNEIFAKRAVQDMYEFNLYHTETLYGEDVVVAIRQYYDTNIRIAVNDPSLSVSAACTVPPNYVSNGYYEIDVTRARNCPDLVKTEKLRQWFPTTKRYKAVLVYGGVSLRDVTPSWRQDGVYSNVSGIVFFYDGTRTN